MNHSVLGTRSFSEERKKKEMEPAKVAVAAKASGTFASSIASLTTVSANVMPATRPPPTRLSRRPVERMAMCVTSN